MSVGICRPRTSSVKSKILGHRLADLVQQPGKVRRARGDPLVELVHRGVLHELGRSRADLALLSEHLRVDRVAPDVGRDHDQPADQGRVLRRGLQRHPAAQGVAHHVRLVQLEMPDERGDVVGHQPHVERPVDVGGPAMPLQVDGDDLVAPGQRGQDRPEHLARPEPAVQQDQRPPGAVRLVVQVDAVDLGVLSGARCVRGPAGIGHGDAPRVVAHGLMPVQTLLRPELIGSTAYEFPPAVRGERSAAPSAKTPAHICRDEAGAAAGPASRS
jgi:hypothetical protein